MQSRAMSLLFRPEHHWDLEVQELTVHWGLQERMNEGVVVGGTDCSSTQPQSSEATSHQRTTT
jgi:hypothetical protein